MKLAIKRKILKLGADRTLRPLSFPGIKLGNSKNSRKRRYQGSLVESILPTIDSHFNDKVKSTCYLWKWWNRRLTENYYRKSYSIRKFHLASSIKIDITQESLPESHFNDILTLSERRSLSCRSQPNNLLSKSVDWFLYHRHFRHEKVKLFKQGGWNKKEIQLNLCIFYFDI